MMNDEPHDLEQVIRQAVRSGREARAAGERLLARSDVHGAELTGYRLVAPLHRGGQGVVWSARQLSTGRTVAVKLLHGGALAGPSARARFEREIAILARLRHPNIVRIIDSGVVEGVPYCVMELMEGRPLDQHLLARGWHAAGRRWQDSDLGLRAALQVFAKVCDAVHAAHLCGVIHRDLKPGNIIVGDDDEPAVLDFGLARLEEAVEAGATRTGELLGSLPWCAPEQVTGHGLVDLRADVYAIGVVLFQALAGGFPYRIDDAPAAVVARIRNEPPRWPADAARDVDADLRAVVARCLRKSPDERYQSAGALAADLRRWIAHEPVEARRGSGIAALRAFARRHRTAAAVTVVVATALSVATFVSAAGWRSAREERDAKDDALVRANRTAERNLAVVAFLRAVLRLADPEAGGGAEVPMGQALAMATRLLDLEAMASEPDVELALRMVVGEACAGVGLLDEASAHLERAARQARAAGDDAIEELVRTLVVQAGVERTRGRLDEAAALAEEACVAARRSPGGRVAGLAASLGELAIVRFEQGRADEAATLVSAALDAHRSAPVGAADVFALAAADLALVQHGQGRFDEAVALLREVRASLPRLDPASIRLHEREAAILAMRGELADAADAMATVATGYAAVYGSSHPHLINVRMNLSFFRSLAGDHAAALAEADTATDVARAALGTDDPRVADCLYTASRAAFAGGDWDVGEARAVAALDLLERRGRGDTELAASARVSIAAAALRRGEVETAEAAALRVIALDETLLPPRCWQRGEAWALAGEASFRTDRLVEAEERLLRGEEIIRASRVPGAYRERVVRNLVALYETWNATDPGDDRAARLAEWRARLDEIQRKRR